MRAAEIREGCDNRQIMASDAGAKQIEINNLEPVGPIRLEIRSKLVARRRSDGRRDSFSVDFDASTSSN